MPIPGHHFAIVFTDLDGTLLDHKTYGYEPALPALARLAQMKVPVVLASSKTHAEMAVFQAEFRLTAPMICENGGGVHWPADWAHAPERETAVTYHEIRQAIDGLPARIRRGFSGFGDWSQSRLMAETGLPPDLARRAAQRQYSEPGLWTGTDEELDELTNLLRSQGLRMMCGGRFQTICGPATKVSRLREIRDRFKAGISPEHSVHTIALGDAPNDIAMLQAADRAFIIANPHGPGIASLPEEASGKIARSQLSGPAGWNLCVMDALDELDGPAARRTQASPG
ncbi:MAG: HAD-IIB family hydrolase [Pseudomonadota bacterium]